VPVRRPGGTRRAAQLVQDVRYEVLPTAGVAGEVLRFVPREVTVTVTASPKRGLEPTVALAECLAAEGYRVVPHLAARSVASVAELAELAERLHKAGVEDVFVPAGDANPPAGPFASALSLLGELARLDHPFSRLGVTGYPESHPKIDDDVTIQAMWDKRSYASYLVSNLCFDAGVISAWVRRVRRRGVDLPIYLGVPGIVDRARLLRVAGSIGVAESSRFLSAHAGWFLRLGSPAAFSPERLLARLAPDVSAPESAVLGCHVFTFNQLEQTESWRRQLLGRFGRDAGSLPVGPAAGG